MTEHDTDFPDVPWPPPQHDENRRNFPVEQLVAYAGQYVAWSWEGDRIVAAAPSRADLIRQLNDAGIDLQRVVFEYLGDP
jgi:hypothetical protein